MWQAMHCALIVLDDRRCIGRRRRSAHSGTGNNSGLLRYVDRRGRDGDRQPEEVNADGALSAKQRGYAIVNAMLLGAGQRQQADGQGGPEEV